MSSEITRPGVPRETWEELRRHAKQRGDSPSDYLRAMLDHTPRHCAERELLQVQKQQGVVVARLGIDIVRRLERILQELSNSPSSDAIVLRNIELTVAEMTQQIRDYGLLAAVFLIHPQEDNHDHDRE